MGFLNDFFYILGGREEEYDKPKKTSIDFVICDKKDKPIACIGFDGLLQGFNGGTNAFA